MNFLLKLFFIAITWSIATLATASELNNKLVINQQNQTVIPLFIKKSNNPKTSASSAESWSINKRTAYSVCIRWEGGQIPLIGHASNETNMARPRRCVQWERRYRTTTYGTANVYRSTDRVLNKPVVIVQPYQFAIEDAVYSADQFYADINQTNFATNLRNRGYDVILYRYHNIDSGIENNAYGLRLLLTKLNNLSGISSTSVVGLSMGGVVARYTLTEMNNKKIAHNVATYISFDAPHLGANIPISVLNTIARIKDKIDNPFCGLVPKCRRARGYFRSILAKLSTKTFKELILDAPTDKGEFNAIRVKLANMGNFPNIPSLAVTNGTAKTTQGFPSTKLTTHFKLHRKWFNGGSVYFKVRTAPVKDNLAGGTANIYQFFSDLIADQKHPITPYITIGQVHSFVSTNSALGGSPANNLFSSVASYPNINEPHMALTGKKVTAITNWLNKYQY